MFYTTSVSRPAVIYRLILAFQFNHKFCVDLHKICNSQPYALTLQEKETKMESEKPVLRGFSFQKIAEMGKQQC